MAELHEQFLHITGPTDVLTFPLETDSLGRVTAGEVVVCVPEARRRARVEGVPVERELLLYALHGMLHLAGFDDRTAPDFATMHRTEDDILTQLGVGPVFSAPRGRVGKGGAPFKTIERPERAHRPEHRPTMGGRATPARRAPERVRPTRRAGKAAGPNGTEGRRR
jgi:probable rRNA maturation factor